MVDIKNLWPAELLNNNDILLPITILHEQAKFFNEMTKNIVIANIETIKVAIANKNPNSSETTPGILHTLKIVAPAIGNYDFELARIIQEELLPYPLRVFAPLMDKRFEASDANEFELVLEEIFKDKKTITAIQSIISQSNSY
jgi:hypothetical protein